MKTSAISSSSGTANWLWSS